MVDLLKPISLFSLAQVKLMNCQGLVWTNTFFSQFLHNQGIFHNVNLIVITKKKAKATLMSGYSDSVSLFVLFYLKTAVSH